MTQSNDVHDSHDSTELASIQARAETLSARFNKITDKLSATLKTSDDLSVSTTDIIEYVDNHIAPATLSDNDLINLSDMLRDFAYIRKTLQDNTEIGRSMLRNMQTDVYTDDSEGMAALVTAFAELNKSINDSLRLYVTAYKELVNIVGNLSTLDKKGNPNHSYACSA